jgi:hypothetical protein
MWAEDVAAMAGYHAAAAPLSEPSPSPFLDATRRLEELMDRAGSYSLRTNLRLVLQAAHSWRLRLDECLTGTTPLRVCRYPLAQDIMQMQVRQMTLQNFPFFHRDEVADHAIADAALLPMADLIAWMNAAIPPP